jgi:hypothetical protein
LPVIWGVLKDAESIDPNIVDAEVLGYIHSIPEGLGKILD